MNRSFMTLVVVITLSRCHCQLNQSSNSELIDEDDYTEGEEDLALNAEAQKRQQHLFQRSPQQPFQPVFNYMPTANVQPNPLRLPNVLNVPSGAQPRWVQPVGNGLPANPNLPAANQPYFYMPSYVSGDTKTTNSYQTPKPAIPSHTVRPPPTSTTPEPSMINRPWDQWPVGASALGAVPAAPLANNAGQRLIVLPNKSPVHAIPSIDSSKLSHQSFLQPTSILGQPDQPLYPQIFAPTTAKSVDKPISSKVQPQTQRVQVVRIQPPTQLDPPKQVQNIFPLGQQQQAYQNETVGTTGDIDVGKPVLTGRGRIGVHTTRGRLLVESYMENYCDIRQYSDDQLLSKNLQRVEYFVANLTCSRYFFECAIGQTFLLNCTSKDQVFDINTVNCNFKYNVKSCNEYDHILHCSIKEECQKDEFACCAEPQQCISYSKRCDGFADCTDGEDENNCPSCGVDEFACVKSGKCISWDKRCNGIPDECFDQTNLDEINCSGCPPEKFSCGKSSESNLQTPVCIDLNLRCNGVRDCPRGEDELNCKSKGQKYLLCESQKQSVSKDQWCDGYEDCLDGSDEKYCVY